VIREKAGSTSFSVILAAILCFRFSGLSFVVSVVWNGFFPF
jgi:hypothetical protein